MPARLVSLALLAALLQLPLSQTAAPPASAARARRPNILIIVTDDQRASGSMGVMPATNRWFGGGGTRYEQAFATTPLCCPSRATIMTGRYAHNHGVQRNERGPAGAGALDHSTTIQRYLHDAGYRTGVFGKLLNHWPTHENPPYWDSWGIFHGQYHRAFFNVDGVVGHRRGYTTNLVKRYSTRFLRGSELDDGRPWFLYVAPFAPHAPYTPEKRYKTAGVPAWTRGRAVTENDKDDKPEYVRRGSRAGASTRAAIVRAKQLRTLMSVDDLVARLAGTLEQLSESRDTLAFFLSDNGFAWGDRGWVGKSIPYTESIRIPFFMRWPAGQVPSRSVSRRIVGTVDIAPTVLDAAGVEDAPRVPLDGRTLLTPWRRPWILTEFWQSTADVDPWAALRGRRFHYIEHYDGSTLRPSFREYYDLGEDPGQRRNLLADRDSSNDPSIVRLTDLSLKLSLARRCAGHAAVTGCP